MKKAFVSKNKKRISECWPNHWRIVQISIVGWHWHAGSFICHTPFNQVSFLFLLPLPPPNLFYFPWNFIWIFENLKWKTIHLIHFQITILIFYVKISKPIFNKMNNYPEMEFKSNEINFFFYIYICEWFMKKKK